MVKNNIEESDEEIEEGSDSDEELSHMTEGGDVEEKENEVENRSDSGDEINQDPGSEKRESGEENDDGSDEEYDDGTDEDNDGANSNEDSDEEVNSDENTFLASLKEALGKTGKQSSSSKVAESRKIEKVEGESVVKMLDLKSNDANIELMKTQKKADNSQPKSGDQKRSSFFLGGESDDNEEVEQSGSDSDEDTEETHQRNVLAKNKSFRPGFDKSRKRDSNSHNHGRDQNFGGKRKQFQKVTSVKKPKFNKGSDRPFNSPAVDRTRNSKNVVKNNTKVKQNDTNKTVDVHPSWEAKQKQKPSIQAFQGKKTVFE